MGGWEKEKFPGRRETTNKAKGLERPQKAELDERRKRNSVQLKAGVDGAGEEGWRSKHGLGPEGPLVWNISKPYLVTACSIGTLLFSARGNPYVSKLPWDLTVLFSRLLPLSNA